MQGRETAPRVTFAVLGPVSAATDSGPVPLGGPRHRAVLARLLIARGRVVPVGRLVTDLWAEPPDGAVAAIRTFVADLRRALEPGRPPRQPARLLVTAAPGYAVRPEPDAVDAWRFEAAVAGAGRLLAEGRAEPALDRLTGALALWQGPAYAGYADQGWAVGEVNRLDELRLLAVERRAEALLALGRAAEATPDLRAHLESRPLREDAWHLLATALYRSGRQGEALAALRQAREILVAELGVDPSPRLRRLEADLLAQAPHLTPELGTPQAAPVSAPSAVPAPTASAAPAPSAVPVPSAVSVPPATPAPSAVARRVFVGRETELTRLVEAADEVVRRREPALVLISGDAGAGKTALAEALTATLAADGWATAWGRIPEYDGAPPGWPWRQITDALPPGAPTGPAASPTGPAVHPTAPAVHPSGPAVHPTGAGPEPERRPAAEPQQQPGPDPGFVADPAVARFRLRRAVVGRLSTVAGQRPALLVVDDLHRADPDTLDLLTALLAEPEPVTGPVLVVGTYRATEITPELTAALARLARTEPLRIYLAGLAEPATGVLAGAVSGRDLDPATVRLVQRRSGGNPFFVRELARLLAAEGPSALETVPAGVRDVIRHRLARLSEPARAVLRWAAVLGRDVDPELLAALAGTGAAEPTEALLLDALDEAVRAGFLTGEETDGRLRFSHVLVRDTLYADLSTPRRARWHTVVAEALEQLRPDDVAALAHHWVRATGRAAAARAAYHAGAAAERAERRTRPHEAARLWRDAVAAYDRSGQGAAPGRLAATMGLGRTLAVTGRLAEARRHRAEAITLAERLDDAALTAQVLATFEVPASWTRNDDEPLSARIVRLAERALGTLAAEHVAQRSRLLSTLALELRGTTSDRGRRAAYQAEESARQAGDPGLLAFALNARFMHTFARTGLAADRAAIGAELVEVAARHGLVTFEVLGHLVGVQAYAALADLGAADAHAADADRLAARYDLPLVGVLTRWYGGLRLAVAGRVGEAEATYRAAAAAQATSGMPGMSRGLLPLALLSLRLSGHDLPEHDLPAWPDGTDWGPEEPWVRPMLLLAAGRRTEAAAALRSLPESPHDLLREARLVLALRAALTLDDHVVLRRVHTELLPAVDELAGAGSGVFSFGPVAGHLAGSAAVLGRPEEAAAHRRTAATVAARAGRGGARPTPDSGGDQR